MTYQPLSEVRKTLRVDWYRCAMKPGRLRELSRRSDAQAWFQAGGHFGLFLLTGAFVAGFWWNELWLGFLVALFCHGTVASFFTGTAPHELGHGTVFKTKWLNKVFLYLFSLIGWWDPFDYASSHTYHHRYTLHVEGDRENLLPLEPSLASTFMLQMFTINLLTQRGRTFGKGGLISTLIITALGAVGRVPADERAPINEWLKALHSDQPEQHRRSILWSRILLAFHGGVLLVAVVSGWWVLPLLLSPARLHRQLAVLLCRPDAALRLARLQPGLPQEHALNQAQPAVFIFVLAHELAYRAPHVRRRALLQPRQTLRRDQRRYAGATQPCGRLERNAHDLGAAENRAGLSVRYAAAADGQSRAPDRGGKPTIGNRVGALNRRSGAGWLA